MENEEQEISCELKDVVEMVYRYNASHPEGCFIFRFVGFEEDKDHTCEECGENCSMKYSDKHSLLGIHGDIETVRNMLNELRDIAEDGIVNI
ncbi:MAG: hypothetical protein AABY22_10825 [Nanoarchaeota archaeon]